MSSTTPPGWFDDGQGGRRWWDGTQWAAPGQGPDQGLDPSSAPTQFGSTMGQQPPAQQSYQQPSAQQPYQQPSAQQPYAQQPYAQQPGYGPGPGGYGAPVPPRRRTGLIIGIVVAVLVLVGAGIGIAFLVGGDDDKGSDEASDNGGGSTQDSTDGSTDEPDDGDPVATVEAFIEASTDVDCDAALALMTSELRDSSAGDCNEAETKEQYETLGIDPDDITYDVGEAEIDGDAANVPVSVSGFGGLSGSDTPVMFDYELMRVDGEWLLSGFGTPLPSETPSDAPS